LFALGAVIYEMATGRLAFDGDTSAVIFDGILNRTPLAPAQINPDVPPKLEEIIFKLLDKDRNLRYRTASDLEVDLKRVRRDSDASRTTVAGTARRDTVEVAKKPQKSSRWVMIPVALTVIAVVVFFVVRGPGRPQAPEEPQVVRDVPPPPTPPPAAPPPLEARGGDTAAPAPRREPEPADTVEIVAVDTYAADSKVSRDTVKEAFSRRGRGGDREQLTVTARYYDAIGNLEQAIKAYETLTRSYPRDAAAHTRLAFLYSEIGKFDSCVSELQESARANPTVQSSLILGNCQLALERVAEARAAYDQAIAMKGDAVAVHSVLYAYTLFKADVAGSQAEWQQLNDPTRIRSGALTGKIAEFRRNLGQRAGRMGQSAGLNTVTVRTLGTQALIDAITLNEPQAKFGADTALRLDPSAIEPAVALAIIGQTEGVQMLENVRKEFPDGTLLHTIWLPLAKAVLETRAGNTMQALDLLTPAKSFEPSALGLMTAYARGLTFLRARSGPEAAAEFEKVLHHPGVVAVAPPSIQILYPLSRLGLARANVLTGNAAVSRQAYQEFFTMWSDADPTVPILVQARREFANFMGARGGGGRRGQR
jgi:tetratricopeptide (TPR) repeat protein